MWSTCQAGIFPEPWINPLGLDDSDVGQVAVAMAEVEAVAHDEDVGNFKAHVIRAHGDNAPSGLVEQGRDLQALGAVRGEKSFQVIERAPRVEDVFDALVSGCSADVLLEA